MATVRLDDLRPGMVLTEEVTDRSRRILLAAGSAIAPKHLRIFRMWGVTQVEVQSGEGQADALGASAGHDTTPAPLALREAEEEARRLFRRVDLTHPAASELFHWCVARLAQQNSVET